VYSSSSKSISSSVQYVTPSKHFSHPSLVIFTFFATPPIKLKLGQQIRLPIANHLDLIIMIDQLETLSSSQIIFVHICYTLFGRCTTVAVACTRQPNLHILTCLHPILLSTARDALTEEASSHCQMHANRGSSQAEPTGTSKSSTGHPL